MHHGLGLARQRRDLRGGTKASADAAYANGNRYRSRRVAGFPHGFGLRSLVSFDSGHLAGEGAPGVWFRSGICGRADQRPMRTWVTWSGCGNFLRWRRCVGPTDRENRSWLRRTECWTRGPCKIRARKRRSPGGFFRMTSFAGRPCLRALCPAEAASIRGYGLKNPICVIPNGIDLPTIAGDHAPRHALFPRAGRCCFTWEGSIPKRDWAICSRPGAARDLGARTGLWPSPGGIKAATKRN